MTHSARWMVLGVLLAGPGSTACGDDGPLAATGADDDNTVLADGDAGVARAEDAGADAPDAAPLPVVEVVAATAELATDPRRGPPYPVVLVHGLNGFRDLGPVDYFFRVPGALEDAGIEVYVTAVAPYDGTPQRAHALAPQIDQILAQSHARKVNIIAHSQGGLDSRYLISTLGYGDRVASVTTVSTPHRGTPVADALLNHEGPVMDGLINAWAWLFGEASADAENNPNARASLETLSSIQTGVFNVQNPDDPRVAYFSFAGRSNLQRADDQCTGEWPNPDAVDTLEPALLPTWTLLAGSLTSPKANDGLVPVDSARWGRFMGCLPADHADEIGQLADLWPELVSGWDPREFYVGWAQTLAGMGY